MTRTVTMKVRRGTAAEATSNNVTLKEGEWGLETDTDKIKIGDGTTAWTALAYWTGGSAIGDVDGPSSSTDNAVTRFDGVTGKLLQNSGVLITDNGSPQIRSGKQLQLYASGNGSNSHIVHNGQELEIWNNVIALDIFTTGQTRTRAIVPQFNNSYPLGDSSLNYTNGYINTIYWDTSESSLNSNGITLGSDHRFIATSANGETGSIWRDNDYFYMDSGDGGGVKMLGSGTLAQTISTAGIITFASFPITPSAAPTTDYQTSNKKYVDDRFPSGATDNAIARYDGATGKIIQNSGVTITDNGSISGTGNAGITSTGSITFVTGASSGIKQSTYTFDSYTAGDAFSARQIGYIDSIGSVSLATNQSVGSAKGRMIMALGTVAKGASGNFAKWGEVPGFTGLTIGAPYYLSNTLGSITTGSVQAAGSVSRILGYGGEAVTKFDLEPSREWIVRG